MLYIVATPIGNLKDITLRALEVLKTVDGVICEDSRRTGLLLHHYQIKKPMIIYNDYNQDRVTPSIIAKLQGGQNLALVSDAGTPLIQDPGYRLVRHCLDNQIGVDSIPGPTAVTTALTLSGMPARHTLFLGFLPDKEQARLDLLKKVLKIGRTIPITCIIFVSPHKMIGTVLDVGKVMGNIAIVIAHELTKVHQSVRELFISEWAEEFQQLLNRTKKGLPKLKGEYVMLIRLLPPATKSEQKMIDKLIKARR